MAREIFCLVVGPPNVVKQGLVVNSLSGESTEIVPTIANILGFDTSIPASAGVKNFNQCDLAQAFF